MLLDVGGDDVDVDDMGRVRWMYLVLSKTRLDKPGKYNLQLSYWMTKPRLCQVIITPIL